MDLKQRLCAVNTGSFSIYKTFNGGFNVSKNKLKTYEFSFTKRNSVVVNCAICGKLETKQYEDYIKNIFYDNKYYCSTCCIKENLVKDEPNQIIYKEKYKKETFEEWCIENNRNDLLDRWNNELNNCLPSEVYKTKGDYWFNCPKGVHEPELKSIACIIKNQNTSAKCNKCNSIGQWIFDNLGNDALEKYWHNSNVLNPFDVPRSSTLKPIFQCQKFEYHIYSVACCSFIQGTRCGYCCSKKVHELDSLGANIPKAIELWSDKNEKTPFEVSIGSLIEVPWWKCSEGIHEDYQRNVHASNTYDFRCPSCAFSKGEKRISEILTIHHILNEPQKTFDGLIGLGGGLLSYDFYLPDHNLLIEYQGEQHEKIIKGFHNSKKDFEKQLEHDRRKKQYAINKNINLLEIWYWDFDNIENILNNGLNLKKKRI
jgi:hypothetical protein